jgi:beta-lactamase regulating signal transducer with metallopeptidase domain
MTPTLLQTLAWSLLHFLWQGAALAAFAAALMFVFRKPSTRYLIGVSTLGLMLLSFAVTVSLLSRVDEPSAAATAAGAPAAALAPPTGTHALPDLVPSNLPWTEGQAAIDSTHDFAWLARGWLIGVFLLALRIAFGLFVIEQLRRRNLIALPDALIERFQALQARLGIQRGIRYAECALVNVPAVIGFFRPVVLIPLRALTGLSPEQLEALVAHELGHIKRFDVAVNFVQVITETLFFFHPAVWWLNKRIRADREDCCDDIAVSAAGSKVGYAKALATIAHWRDVPDFAMAATGGPVAARVARLLGVNRDGSRTAGVFTASVVLAAALMAGAVSLGFADSAQAQTRTDEPSLPAPPAPAPVAPPAPAAKPAPAARPAAAARPAPAAKPAPMARPAPAPKPAPGVGEQVEEKDDVTSPEEIEIRSDVSFIEEMRDVVGEVDVDDLIALKNQGVTAKYISQLRSRGLNASVDQIIAMKTHDITPNYVKQVRDMGFDASIDDLIAFKVHDVSAEFVQQIRGMGFAADADAIVAMKVQGVSAEFVKQMRDLGLKFDQDELIAMRVHGITAEYVKAMRANGFDVDADQLIAMRVHDVTPEYRKSLESAGLKVNVDDLVHAKVMDITPAFISKVNSHGFRNLDLDQLIALKNADVL